MRKSLALLLAVMMVLGSMMVASAGSYEFPSTNDANREAGHPHVNLVNVGEDYVTLEFVMNYDFLAFFEYRIDGEESPYLGTDWENTHTIVDEDGNWRYDDPEYPNFTDPGPGNYYHMIGLDPSGKVVDTRVTHDNSRIDTFNVDEKIEIRLALGAERDYDFDWVTFYVEPAIEYQAAPAVAARLLSDADVDNRYGRGRTGGNFIADVARHMEDSTNFDGVMKSDAMAYECAVAAFLNDPANGEYYPAGVECTPQYEFVEQVEVDSAEILGADTVNVLDEEIEYKFVATGTWVNGNVHDGVDAEYRLPAGETIWESSVGKSLRLQVNEEYFNWSDGEFNPEHIYEAYFIGEGSLVNFRINDGNPPRPEWYGDNYGSLFVDIYKVNW